MRIWLINLFCDLPGEGAGEGRFLTLAKVFAEMGHDVTWWTMDFHHRSKSHRTEAIRQAAETELRALGLSGSIQIRMIPVPGYRKNISFKRIHSHRQFASQFLKLAGPASQAEPPDRIVVSSPPLTAGDAALKLGQRYQCPVALDLTDQWPHTFERILPGSPELRKRLGSLLFAPQYAAARRLYESASLVSAVSQEYLDEVTQRSPAQKTHLCYIGGGLKPTPSRDPSASKTKFVYVGAMTGSYDLPTVLDAACLLQKEDCAFEVHFAGSGHEESSLRQAMEAKGLQSCCRFHGFLDQQGLDALLAQMDVGLNAIRPGIAITMPHKLSDYLCAELPVINSLVGESDALLRDAKCGRFYTAGDARSLAAAMKAYLNPENRESGRQQAAALAARSFDRSQTYPEWARVVVGLGA